jgi:hypothetical protein
MYSSLEDGLRAHLLLHRHPAAGDEIADMLVALREDTALPLSREDAEQVRRLSSLHARVACGETVTLTQESMNAHYHFVATLLMRYGVAVVAPEIADDEGQLPATLKRDDRIEQLKLWWNRHRSKLVPLLLVLVVVLAAATTMLLIQQSRLVKGSTATPTPTLAPPAVIFDAPPTVPPPSLPTPTPVQRGQLQVGQTVYVREGITGGLALREQPGTAEDIPIKIYLTSGTAVEVVDGPVEQDGYRWWRVRAASYEGWCAGEFLRGG